MLFRSGVVLAVAVSLYMVRRTGLDPAVSACLLIGGCLLLAPGLMPWDSLWLLPFIALSIRRWWVLIVWTLAETVFAISIQLGAVSGFEADEGLASTFVALFTLLRLLALVLVVIMSGENLYRRGIRGATATAGPPRRGDEPGNAPTDASDAAHGEPQSVGRKEEHESGHDSQRTRRLD